MRPKTLWRVLKNSLTNASYYLLLIKEPLWFSFRFFLSCMVLLGITAAIRINQRQLPQIKTTLEASLEQLEQEYPAELELSWDGQKLTMSPAVEVEVPYPQALDQDWLQLPDLPHTFGYLTPTTLNAAELPFNSLFAITPKQLFINDLGRGWSGLELSTLLPNEELIVNQTTLPEQLPHIKSWLNQIGAAFKNINLILIPSILIMFKSWTALINGFLIFLLFKLYRYRLNFKQAIQLSLHLVVVGELIAQAGYWLYPQLSIPLFTLSYWIILSYLLLSQRSGWP